MDYREPDLRVTVVSGVLSFMPRYFTTALPISHDRLLSWSLAALRSTVSMAGVVTKLMVTVFLRIPDNNTSAHMLTNIDS